MSRDLIFSWDRLLCQTFWREVLPIVPTTGSGVLRALKAKPDIQFTEDDSGEEVVATIPVA